MANGTACTSFVCVGVPILVVGCIVLIFLGIAFACRGRIKKDPTGMEEWRKEHPNIEPDFDPNDHKWPEMVKTKYMLPEHARTIEVKPNGGLFLKRTSNDGRCIYTDRVIRNYYEVTIQSLNVGEEMRVSLSVGFASTPYPSFRMPGWELYSLAVNSSRGNVLLNDRSGKGIPFMDAFREGDVIGAGYFPNSQDPAFDDFYFTLNGNYMGIAVTTDCLRDVAFGAIGLIGNASLKVNFGDTPFMWPIANMQTTRLAYVPKAEDNAAGRNYPNFANNVEGLKVAMGGEWDGERVYNEEGKLVSEDVTEMAILEASKRTLGVRRMSFVDSNILLKQREAAIRQQPAFAQYSVHGEDPVQKSNDSMQNRGMQFTKVKPGMSAAAKLTAAKEAGQLMQRPAVQERAEADHRFNQEYHNNESQESIEMAEITDDEEEEEVEKKSSKSSVSALQQMRAATANKQAQTASGGFGRGLPRSAAVISKTRSGQRGSASGVSGLDNLDAIVAGNPPPPSASAARRVSQESTNSRDLRIEMGKRN